MGGAVAGRRARLSRLDDLESRSCSRRVDLGDRTGGMTGPIGQEVIRGRGVLIDVFDQTILVLILVVNIPRSCPRHRV